MQLGEVLQVFYILEQIIDSHLENGHLHGIHINVILDIEKVLNIRQVLLNLLQEILMLVQVVMNQEVMDNYL